MDQKSIMIVGLGDLGGYVLEFLARVAGIPKI
jgi:tRNA A37 threonylcarbamoyladenosine dehydratase